MTLAFKCSRAYSNVIGGLRLFDFAIEEYGGTKEGGGGNDVQFEWAALRGGRLLIVFWQKMFDSLKKCRKKLRPPPPAE